MVPNIYGYYLSLYFSKIFCYEEQHIIELTQAKNWAA